jgi:hypothetical protein
MSKKYKNTTPRLDLHGIKHQDVEVMVENFVIFSEKLPLEIITGHSEKMKSIVIDILEYHGYNYRIGDFYNKGYISVIS